MIHSRLSVVLVALSLVACGGESTPSEPQQGAAAPTAESPVAAEAAPAAPPAPDVPPPPATVGDFGPFVLSADTISTDGQCLEIGMADVTPELEARMRETLVRMFGVAETAITSNRCPAGDRLPGSCSIRQLQALNYYYSIGEHAMTPESARAHCQELRGGWAD